MVRQPSGDDESGWPPDRFASSLAPYFERFDHVVFDHQSRLSDKTTITPSGQGLWNVSQILCDPKGEDLWCIEGTVDLNDVQSLDGPIIGVERIGT